MSVLTLYTSDVCPECKRVKAALGGLSVLFAEEPAEAIYDLPGDVDAISGALTEAKGRLPILRVGRFLFAVVGEVTP
jgi:hypothetical protein